MIPFACLCQSTEYQQRKAEKIAEGSVFTKIIERELPANIEFEDEEITAFVSLRTQAPVHFLIVPKKEIYTVMILLKKIL